VARISEAGPERTFRTVEGFAIFDVSTKDGWAAGRAQRREWGRDQSVVIPLDLERVIIVLFASDGAEAAA